MREIEYKAITEPMVIGESSKWAFGTIVEIFEENKDAHIEGGLYNYFSRTFRKVWKMSEFDEWKSNTIYNIDKETICQYTGMKDINDAKIYENDIVILNGDMENKGYVKYIDGCFMVVLTDIHGNDINGDAEYLYKHIEYVEVIGNVYNYRIPLKL